MKRLTWLGDSREAIREFSADARSDAGFQLFRVQLGVEPHDWKPMPSIGSGVKEIRIHAGNEYRVIYVAKFEEAVYVLHAFHKKTQKTARKDIELARTRYRQLLSERGKRGWK